MNYCARRALPDDNEANFQAFPAVDGKQYVATIAGHSFVAFALRD